ncbi:MAG TPA: NAD-dependent epimerase/dehydratase family protein [Steroidobacteraceae bacterium]|nr:NAD-dependent epimerase/dehydratase family protein [Steroidobacteraceae bacterium]
MRMTRRDLVRLSSAALLALSAGEQLASAADTAKRPGKPLRILILGGTGFTGPHQVRYALSRGHQITLFNRGKQPHEWPGAVEELIGDRNTGDLKALEGREWDVCIDNPTTLPFWVRDAGRVLQGKVKHYVFISTISVYADDLKPADESAPVAGYTGKDAMAETLESLRAKGELYGPLKAFSEKEAQKQFPGKATIIRPGLIVGPGDETDRFTYWPVRLARGGEVLAPGDGSDPVQIIDARDLAEWTIRMAETRTLGTFNATGPDHSLQMKEMLSGIAAAIHADARPIWVPADFLASEKVEAWSNMPVWVPGHGDTAGFARRSIAKALAAGLRFRPLDMTASDTLTWFGQQPAERQAKLKAGLTPEREQGVLAKWKSTRVG